jgi:hypothetical protein
MSAAEREQMLHTQCLQHFRNAVATMHHCYLSPVGAEFSSENAISSAQIACTRRFHR